MRRQAALRREAIRQLAATGPLPSTRKLAERFQVDKEAIRRDLRAIGHVAPTEAGDFPSGAPPTAPAGDVPRERRAGDTAPATAPRSPPPSADGAAGTDEAPAGPANPPPEASGTAPGPGPTAPAAGATGSSPPDPAPDREAEPPARFDQIVVPPAVTEHDRQLLGAMDARMRGLLAPILQNLTRQQQTIEQLAHPNEQGDYPIGEAPGKAENRVTSKLIAQTGNESLRIVEWDLGAGEIIRRRWRGGWSTRFDDPVRLAQFAIDFLAENEDRIREVEEERDRAVARAEWLAGFVNPVRRLKWMEERLLAMTFAAQLQGQPFSSDAVRTLFSLLQDSAKAPIHREESLSTPDVEART
jgi:hypothetical protein